MRTLILALCILILTYGCKPSINQDETISIIPKPVSLEKKGGICYFDSTSIIECKDSMLIGIGNYLWERLKSDRGLVLESVCRNISATNAVHIFLSVDSTMSYSEGYKLEVDNSEIRIIGKDQAGLFYGIQTFLQIFPTSFGEKKGSKKIFSLPALRIMDYPRFAWRGMMLDVSRHFFPIDSVKRLIDLLAMHKMNVFHWHLTDDQGWRIEIKKYPKLTEIGGWRVNRENQPWDKWDLIKKDEKATYGGYYSQEDIKDIVKYAQNRFVTIVPEIEMPAHAMAALAAYPELSCTGEKLAVVPGGVWPITHIYCAGNEQTFRMLEEVLSEVIDLFPSKYIHIGGDEATKSNWEKCKKCQLRIKTENLKNVQELQSYFIKRIEKFIVQKNRHLIGWDEILEGGLAPEATVMSWRGINGGIEAARQNHYVIMTPTDYLYFDYYQALKGEPIAIGGFLPLKKVYSYEPLPSELNSFQHKYILGAQANLWTEYIHDFNHLEYMMLPRLCALAELDWSQIASRSYEDFTLRMANHYNRLDLLNVKYREPDIIGLEPIIRFDGHTKVLLKSPRPEWVLHFTLDGGEPSSSSKIYSSPITISSSCILSVRPFLSNQAVGRLQMSEYIKLEYISPSEIEPVNKGLNFECFRGDYTEISQLDSAKAIMSGLTDSIGTPLNENTKLSVIVLNGFIKIKKKDIYKLTVTYNSWSNLLINDKLLIDHGMGSEKSVENTIKLKIGYYAFKLIYFSGEKAIAPKVFLESKSSSKELINCSMLYR